MWHLVSSKLHKTTKGLFDCGFGIIARISGEYLLWNCDSFLVKYSILMSPHDLDFEFKIILVNTLYPLYLRFDCDNDACTCLLLLISMLWHRQVIFESKGDKLSSSAEHFWLTHYIHYIHDLIVITMHVQIHSIDHSDINKSVVNIQLHTCIVAHMPTCWTLLTTPAFYNQVIICKQANLSDSDDKLTFWCLFDFFLILLQFSIPFYVKKWKMDNFMWLSKSEWAERLRGLRLSLLALVIFRDCMVRREI